MIKKIVSYPINSEIHTITLDVSKRKFYHAYYDKNNPLVSGYGEVKNYEREVQFYLDMYSIIEEELDKILGIK